MEVGHGPGDTLLDGDPAPHGNGQGHSSPSPTFRPMSTVDKRSPISATAELLLSFKARIYRRTVYSEQQWRLTSDILVSVSSL